MGRGKLAAAVGEFYGLGLGERLARAHRDTMDRLLFEVISVSRRADEAHRVLVAGGALVVRIDGSMETWVDGQLRRVS